MASREPLSIGPSPALVSTLIEWPTLGHTYLFCYLTPCLLRTLLPLWCLPCGAPCPLTNSIHSPRSSLDICFSIKPSLTLQWEAMSFPSGLPQARSSLSCVHGLVLFLSETHLSPLLILSLMLFCVISVPKTFGARAQF